MMYIVTRHKGAVAWIKKHYPIFSKFVVLKFIDEEQIKGNVIIGTLPINLAVLAKEYWHLSMKIPLEMSGKEFTIEDMEEFGCQIVRYKIEKVDQDTRKGNYL